MKVIFKGLPVIKTRNGTFSAFFGLGLGLINTIIIYPEIWMVNRSIYLQDFTDIDQENPDAVVVGLAPEKFSYETLTLAFRLLKENKAPLIAIHKARYFAAKDGLSLGPGKLALSMSI